YVYDVKDQSIYDTRDQSVYDVEERSIYDVKERSIYDVSNWSLNEKNYRMFLDKFFNKENIDKIANKLRENGLNRYARLISGGGGYLKEFVYFDVWPPYTDISKAKITE
ncbi:unnamed protein product, partial [marine sediment metagenome]